MKGLKNKIRQRWYLRWILIFSTWLFQGMVHSDLTEKSYRITCTLVFSLPFLYLFYAFTPWSFIQVLLMALIVGHTLNWFVNGNFSTIIIHRLFLKRSIKKDLFKFTDYLERRVQGKAFILYVAVFGSMSRGELKGSSDLDVSIVRKPGLANALPALREVFIIKKMADLKGVPLEIFLSDTPENSVDRFKGETVPVVIYDPDGSLEKYYTKTMSLEEAYKLNHP